MKSYRIILPNLALLIGIALCAATAEASQTWSGKVEIISDVRDNLDIATTADVAIYQDGYVVSNMVAHGLFGVDDHSVAYILRDGLFTGAQYLQADGRYLHFRQTGGTVNFSAIAHTRAANTANTLPYDLVFGGVADAYLPFWGEDDKTGSAGTEFRECNVNIAVMDDANVYGGLFRADGLGTNYTHVIALNGGLLTMSTREGSRNVYFAFNGGTLQPLDGAGGAYIFGESKVTAAKYDPWIRVYEKGGRVIHRSKGTGDNQYVRPPPICEPVDNVVWSIPIPEGHELKTRVWDTPPSIVIVDSTEAGSNAVAVADWDFYSGHVTNITVLCRGENYSACGADDEKPTVTAKFRLSVADNLASCLSVPVVTGPGVSGDFAFGGNENGCGFQVQYVTNTYRGATIIDTDIDGEYEHNTNTTGLANYKHVVMVEPTRGSTCFLNTTNIIMKSGLLDPGSSSISAIFPSVTRLELYGGHIVRISHTFKDVVVGGETWLRNYTLTASTAVTVTVPADGTLAVDYGAVVTNGVIVQPKLKYGTVTLNSGAKIMVKDWEKLPRGKKVPVLDLSGVTTFTTKANATLVSDDEGDIFWGEGDDAKILYARRRADGYFMIFK